MANVIVTAENWAFGPVSTLLTVCKRLLENGHRITFVGHGTSYQLAKRDLFADVVDLDTDSPSFAQEAMPVFEHQDILLTSMDRSSVRLAHSLGLPTIWLDILFWWWDELPDYVLDVDCFIKQNTINDEGNLKKYASRMREVHSVGPIVDLSASSGKVSKNQALVAFGGMESQRASFWVGVNTRYPYYMTELLIGQVDLRNYDRVLITGNEYIVEELGKRYVSPTFEFRTLPHYEFAQEMASSSVVLTAPGLQTTLEAFCYRVPTIFLPPSNSSQYVQLDRFVETGCGQTAVHLKDYYPALDLMQYDTIERMAKFLEQLSLYEIDQRAQSDTALRISAFLSDSGLLAEQVDAQDTYIESLGSNGLDQTIQIIEQFITQFLRAGHATSIKRA